MKKNIYKNYNFTLYQRFKLLMGWYDLKSIFIWYNISVLVFTILSLLFSIEFIPFSYDNYDSNPIIIFIGMLMMFITMFMSYWILMIFLIPLAPFFLLSILTNDYSEFLGSYSITWFYIPMIISSLYMRTRKDLRNNYIDRISSLHYGRSRYGNYRYQTATPVYQDSNINKVPVKLSEGKVYCYKCGKPIKKDVSFCSFCGSIREPKKTTGHSKKNEELLNMLIGMVDVKRSVSIVDAANFLGITATQVEKILYDAIGKGITELTIDEKNIISLKTVTPDKLTPSYYKIDNIEVAATDSEFTCMICKTGISKNENYAACPHCDHNAHINHLKEWLKVNSLCPVCKQLLTVDEMIIVNVKKKID